MPGANIRDLNIRDKKHPKFSPTRVEENRSIEFVIQKLENLLFTNKGDVLGDDNFGCDLEYYLWSTNVPVSKIESNVKEQIDQYIPELNSIGYTSNIQLYEGTVRDILLLDFKIKDVSINFFVR